jgi:hypothetical protein
VNADELENVERDGWFVTAAGMVGDLGNPYYREERQRDVWNEAAAVGLQVVLWLGLGTAAAMVWLGGATALPYAVAVLVVLGTASGVSILYARTLGVRVDDAGRLLRLRLVPYCVLLVLFLVGAMRAVPTSGFGAGLAWGAAAGGALTVLWLVGSGLRARRREQHHEV